MLNDCFLSIVSKDCRRDELRVRARREGDIEKVFPNATVTRYTKSDYLFRAVVKRTTVEEALAGEVQRILYGNFKSSVRDRPLHDAYLRVWSIMAELQPTKPYSGLSREEPVGFDFGDDHAPPVRKRQARRRSRK